MEWSGVGWWWWWYQEVEEWTSWSLGAAMDWMLLLLLSRWVPSVFWDGCLEIQTSTAYAGAFPVNAKLAIRSVRRNGSESVATSVPRLCVGPGLAEIHTLRGALQTFVGRSGRRGRNGRMTNAFLMSILPPYI